MPNDLELERLAELGAISLEQFEADNQAMLERLEAAAPAGFTWNTAAGRYVPK